MRVLVFDIGGKLAHFRRPDTTQTHTTYPIITRTALRGLIGSILGLHEFQGDAWTGVQLLAPVRTVAQQMSLLGKGFLGGGSSFNRPTSIELIVSPHYRIYYHGDYQEELAERLRRNESCYHTHLGSAFALTFPRYIAELELDEIKLKEGESYASCTVLPAHVIRRLVLSQEELQYGRVGGVLYEYLGGRRFRGTIDLIYETKGRPIQFLAAGPEISPPVRFVHHAIGNSTRGSDNTELIALW